MALTPGTRLGAYEITGTLGAGGMGEVYRATDTNLKRAVAIKVLPESLATDRDRLARFQREAEVLASLNHPNIAAIYGLERSDRTTALVMELVDGPTLADRIAQGPIPVDEALAIAKQIAEALEAAHEQGIIHRDLKPANVKVRPDGTVKVLDFGLAKALEPASSANVNATASPTITSPAMTGVGVLLGTAAYMSPEQARGKAVDKRSDIWAFGCVLYEMLTAKRAFGSDDITDTLAFIITKDADWRALPTSTPSSVQRLLRRCLEKNPKQRLRDIGDARLDLIDGQESQLLQRPTRHRWPWAAAAVVGALAGGFAAWTFAPASTPREQYFAVGVEGGERPWRSQLGSVAVSPDGRHVAYVSTLAGARYLRLWSIERGTSTTLAADGLPVAPFFSPDGQWIGFYDEVDSALRRVRTDGGTAQTICRFTTALRGATWARDDTIVFAVTTPGTGLFRVAASGGTPQMLTPADDVQNHRWPAMLPDDRGVLFTIFEAGRTQLAVLNLATGAHRVIVPNGSRARYVPSGHVVFGNAGGLAAIPFDTDRLEAAGPQVPVFDNATATTVGLADFDVSETGTLVYLPAGDDANVMGWVTGAGQMTPLVTAGDLRFPRLSPDGSRVAFVTQGRGTGGLDIWVRDLVRGSDARITVDAHNGWPVWTPDGDTLTFGSNRQDLSSFDLFSVRADLPAEETRIADLTLGIPADWSPRGDLLLYTEFKVDGINANTDIWMRSADGATVKPFLATRFSERSPRLSPDGQWVAYVSDLSGESRIYLQRFPQGGEVVPVSSGAGTEPVWSHDGRRLFYRDAHRLLAVDVTGGAIPGVSQPRVVLTGPYHTDVNALGYPNYDVSPDGTRFLMIADTAAATSPPRIVLNWTEELKRLVRAN